MTVAEFCRKHADFGQLIAIRDKGVIKGSVYINEKNTALIPIQYTNDYVRKTSWGFLKTANEDGSINEIPCRFVDV